MLQVLGDASRDRGAALSGEALDDLDVAAQICDERFDGGGIARLWKLRLETSGKICRPREQVSMGP